jgi:hypothetical protein
MTGEKESAQIKTCPSAILSATYPKWTALRLHMGLRDEKLVTDY